MKRRLAAALAVRNEGSRLYGKPMQNLLGSTSILEQIINAIRTFPVIDEIVLGVSEGLGNDPFIHMAHKLKTSYIIGHPTDVLMRLIQCGRAAKATDVFRVTTECPWFDGELFAKAWEQHVANNNDITTCDFVPEGLGFEIYKLDSLEYGHAKGSSTDRSEFCSNYFRFHPEEFKIQFLFPPEKLQRLDLRVTVDYPEDLVLCRAIAKACEASMPMVTLKQIVEFLDSRPDLKKLVADFVVPKPLWGETSEKLRKQFSEAR